MQLKSLLLVLASAVVSIHDVSAQIPPAVPVRDVQNPANTAVQISYMCTPPASSTSSTVTCTLAAPFELKENQRLVIQNVSGSATPPPFNLVNGVFNTGQANAVIISQLGEQPINNIIGPNYALKGSAIWYFNTPTVIYSDAVPVVQNYNGPVYIQGYIVYK